MLNKIISFLYLHFYRHTLRTPWEFCWKITVEKTILKALILILAIAFSPNKNVITDAICLHDYYYAVFIAPIIETIIFQQIIIFLLKDYKRSFTAQIFYSTMAFAAAHFFEGPLSGVAAGIVGGFYYAFSYAHWSNKSHFMAFKITAGAHAMGNSLIIAIQVMLYTMLC